MPKQKTFLGVELSSSKKVNFLVLVSIIGLLGLIIGAPYLYDKRDAIYAPMYIDSSREHGVIFNIDHSLCLTDADGTLINNRSYKDLGIKEIADAKFFNNSIILVQGNGKIKQCSTSLNSCTTIGSVSSYRADIFMRIIPSKDERSFYIVQTNKSKIDKFDTTGKHLYRLNLKEKEMKYPGGGVALTNDTILVANTKYKRVIAIQDKGEDNNSVVWSLSSYSDMKRHSFRKVLDVKLDASSNIWMTNTNKSYEKADVLIMDVPTIKNYKADINLSTLIEVEDGHTQRIESKLVKYPTSLAPHKEGMLILDSETFKILYTDNSYIPTEFGESYVKNRLKKLSEKRAYYQNIINGLFWFFGIGMLLAIVAAIMEMPRAAKKVMEESENIDYIEKQSIPESKRIEPDENGIIWLPPSEKLIKQLKWINLLVWVAILFMIYQPITLLNTMDTLERHMDLILEVIGLIFATLLFMYFHYSFDYAKYAIGVDETSLYIHTAMNKQAMDTFENIVYLTQKDFFTNNSYPIRIAIGNITIPLMYRNEEVLNGGLFDPEQFDYYIKPKLKFAKRISWNEMLHRQIKGISLRMWVLLSFVAILMAILYIDPSVLNQ